MKKVTKTTRNINDTVFTKPHLVFAFLSKHLVGSRLQVLSVASPSDFTSNEDDTFEFTAPGEAHHRYRRHRRRVKEKRMSDRMVRKCFAYLDVLATYLGLTRTQTATLVAVLSYNLNNECSADVDDIESFFRLNHLDAIPLKKAADELVDSMIFHSLCGCNNLSYLCDANVRNCIMKNKPFQAPDAKSFTRYKFCKSTALYAKLNQKGSETVKIYDDFARLERAHSDLKFVQSINKLLTSETDRIFFCCVCDVASRNPLAKVNVDSLCSAVCKATGEKLRYVKSITEQTNPMFKCDLLEYKEGDLFTANQVFLTETARRLFFEDDFDYLSVEAQKRASLIYPAEIKSVNLYYDSEFNSTINPLRVALTGDNFTELQRRLEERNLPKGVAAIFYGAPGTGKTEMVKQLARETGRAVMHVDISQTKSMFVGGSERQVKDIFDRYRRLCKVEKIKPILLFNEADALFSKRMDISSSDNPSVDQMMNSLQNIILEEMENLDGILIATTNLQTTFDDAFARRFLYKVKFLKPDKDVKKQIWRDKLSTLTPDEAETLSVRYDFSGGEIDNIVRKSVLNEVVSGHKADFSDILSYCDSEHFKRGAERRIGF